MAGPRCWAALYDRPPTLPNVTMNHKADNQQLLDDVLSEAMPADFRETLLGGTLRLAGRRRRWRQTRHAAVLLVALGFSAVLVRLNFPPRPLVSMPMARATVKSYELIHTEPLPASAIVTTQPLAAAQLVTSVGTVDFVETMPGSGSFRVINDDELLALIGSRPTALVPVGPHSEELVFVNPADEKDFPVN